MIASRFRPVARCMSTLVFDQRHALPLPQRIEALPKRMSKFTHAHRNALGIQFYGAASPNDIAPTSPGEGTFSPASMMSPTVSSYRRNATCIACRAPVLAVKCRFGG